VYCCDSIPPFFSSDHTQPVVRQPLDTHTSLRDRPGLGRVLLFAFGISCTNRERRIHHHPFHPEAQCECPSAIPPPLLWLAHRSRGRMLLFSLGLARRIRADIFCASEGLLWAQSRDWPADSCTIVDRILLLWDRLCLSRAEDRNLLHSSKCTTRLRKKSTQGLPQSLHTVSGAGGLLSLPCGGPQNTVDSHSSPVGFQVSLCLFAIQIQWRAAHAGLALRVCPADVCLSPFLVHTTLCLWGSLALSHSLSLLWLLCVSAKGFARRSGQGFRLRGVQPVSFTW